MLGAPRFAGLSAVNDDVLDSALLEVVAGGESCLPCAYDYGVV